MFIDMRVCGQKLVDGQNVGLVVETAARVGSELSKSQVIQQKSQLLECKLILHQALHILLRIGFGLVRLLSGLKEVLHSAEELVNEPLAHDRVRLGIRLLAFIFRQAR